jgi:hypothetical protein
MKSKLNPARLFGRSVWNVALIFFLVFVASFSLLPRKVDADSQPANSLPQVQLDVRNAGPRTLESITQQNLVRHYTNAWQTLAAAFDNNASSSLGDYFVGPAREQLAEAVAGQQKTGMHSRYLEQRHKVEVVFYAPEGDVVELHDTLECQFQVFDGDKSIHDERAVLRYVVLMTPSADRWVVRQLQAVSQF